MTSAATRILVAEDDDHTLIILESLLKLWGYEVIPCVDGAQAWEQLQKPDAPKLVVLDWMMPCLTAVEITRKLRLLPTDNPPYVLVVTAMSGQERLMEAFAAGIDEFIRKPFDPGELQARVAVGARILKLQENLAQRVTQLEEALANVKTLSGLLPICAYCKKIRNDRNYWEKIECFISSHSEAEFTHGICPDCLKIETAKL